MRSHEFPLICLYVDVGIESKSILSFHSFRIVSSYGAWMKLTAYETKQNGSLSSYCDDRLVSILVWLAVHASGNLVTKASNTDPLPPY